MSQETKPTITETIFDTLNDLLIEALDIDRQEKELKRRKELNRAQLVEIGLPLLTEQSSRPAPGFTISEKREAKFDENQALQWTLDPANIEGSAAYLLVKPEMVATVIQLVLKNQINPATVFDLNKSGYAAGVKSNAQVGMPYDGIGVNYIVSIEAKAVKTNADLAAAYNIIEDETVA